MGILVEGIMVNNHYLIKPHFFEGCVVAIYSHEKTQKQKTPNCFHPSDPGASKTTFFDPPFVKYFPDGGFKHFVSIFTR